MPTNFRSRLSWNSRFRSRRLLSTLAFRERRQEFSLGECLKYLTLVIYSGVLLAGDHLISAIRNPAADFWQDAQPDWLHGSPGETLSFFAEFHQSKHSIISISSDILFSTDQQLGYFKTVRAARSTKFFWGIFWQKEIWKTYWYFMDVF